MSKTGGARTVHLDEGVDEWLKTGRGFVVGGGFTRGGTPARNAEDLQRALREHMAAERKHPDHAARHGMETKFQTRDYTLDEDGSKNPFWLWINTSTGRGRHARGVISVVVDHG